MENTEILHKVEEVFRDVLDDEEIALILILKADPVLDRAEIVTQMNVARRTCS